MNDEKKIINLEDLLTVDNQISSYANIYEDITSTCSFVLDNNPEITYNAPTTYLNGIPSSSPYYNRIYSTTINVSGGDYYLVYGWDYFFSTMSAFSDSYGYVSDTMCFYTNPVECIVNQQYTRYFLGYYRNDVERFNTNSLWMYKSLEFFIPPGVTQMKVYDFTNCVNTNTNMALPEVRIFKITRMTI